MLLRFPLERVRHRRASAVSKPNSAGSARFPSLSNSEEKIRNFSVGIPLERQLLTAESPTPQSAATFAVPPKASITSSIVRSMAPSYSRSVESSSLHDAEIATACEQWLNSAMISEREFDASLSWRLRVLRKAMGRTQPEFGGAMGVGGSAVSNYEKDQRSASARRLSTFQLLQLSMTYHTPIEWLIAADESRLDDALRAKLTKAEAELKAEMATKSDKASRTVKPARRRSAR